MWKISSVEAESLILSYFLVVKIEFFGERSHVVLREQSTILWTFGDWRFAFANAYLIMQKDF
jgi:hypothetical protein